MRLHMSLTSWSFKGPPIQVQPLATPFCQSDIVEQVTHFFLFYVGLYKQCNAHCPKLGSHHMHALNEAQTKPFLNVNKNKIRCMPAMVDGWSKRLNSKYVSPNLQRSLAQNTRSNIQNLLIRDWSKKDFNNFEDLTHL